MYLRKHHLFYYNRLLLSTLLILFVSCFNNTKKRSQIVLDDSPIKSEEIEECHNSDASFISAYQDMLSKCTDEWEKKFIYQLIETFENFSNKALDTVLYTTCFIESNERLDTIATRIFENEDGIVVYYSWVKNGKLLWEKKISDPYVWVKDDTFFYNEEWIKWIRFTTGIYYAPPEIYEISDIELYDFFVERVLSELQGLGFTIDRESYEQYIESFTGNLIVWGEPEVRDGVFIWYEPLQRFVIYYRP